MWQQGLKQAATDTADVAPPATIEGARRRSPNHMEGCHRATRAASGNLCMRQRLSPRISPLTAGHCLLTPPKGKPDKAVALRFCGAKGYGAMKSTALKAALNRRWADV